MMQWREVRVSPAAVQDFPTESRQSHYYAARKTNAAPLAVGSQKERFLFYRGDGTFPLPISVKMSDGGKILAKNLGTDTVSGAILFENRGGLRRYVHGGILTNDIVYD